MRAAAFGLVLVFVGGAAFAAAPGGTVRVGPGSFRPVYAPDPSTTVIEVGAFELDRVPVTNGEFAAFVRGHPQWRRDRVAHVFADNGYLTHWADPIELGPAADADQPVTHVSWFAAKAYCAARGQRLPTEAEWEFASAAGEKGADGSAESGLRQRTLAWYSRPAGGRLERVGRGTPNYWGVFDLNGLVWEWVLDFNSTLVSGDSRTAASADRMQFCGAGALASGDKQDYASFMRLAFRGSLEARYTTSALGFRCARDAEAASR
jgi:sulfatase modifying factor 1